MPAVAAAAAGAASKDVATVASLHSPADFFAALQRAAQTIAECSAEDDKWPDLASVLNASQYLYRLHLNAPWAPFEKRRVLGIPDAVIQASTSAEVYAAQGLFPDIGRAWIVIDTRLYLWNYLDDSSSSAFESYEHPDSVITSVGLVKPRPGVFIDAIAHVLVVCTATSLTLLGLAFEKPTGAAAAAAGSTQLELKLYVTEMNVRSEGVSLSGVEGTQDGRIFCRGSDGCAYEVVYQVGETWFKRRCTLRNLSTPSLSYLLPAFMQSQQKQKLNYLAVDSERSVLYTLHELTEIEVYVIPRTGGAPPTSIARAKDIRKHAHMICPNNALLHDFAIVWLGVVPSSESKTVHLVALTSRGVRLYFSHSRIRYGDPGPATCLELLYVRPPPPRGARDERALAPRAPGSAPRPESSTGYTPDAPVLTQVKHALYADGVLLTAAPDPTDASGRANVLFAVSRALVARRTNVPPPIAAPGSTRPNTFDQLELATPSQGAVEPDMATFLSVRGNTWGIAEVRRPAAEATIQAAAGASSQGRVTPLATQFITPPRVFLVLTSLGLNVLAEMRPIDTLRALLEKATVSNSSVREFFDKYGQAQSCAMALAIASHNSQLLIAPEMLLAGETSSHLAETPRILSSETVAHAWRIFFDYGGHPRYEAPPYPSQPASDGKVSLSGRHDGLALYLARLLRPFWTKNVTRKVQLAGEGERQDTNVPKATLLAAQKDLRLLQTFVVQNAQFFGVLSAMDAVKGVLPAASATTRAIAKPVSEGEKIAARTEQVSFEALRALLSRSLEALSFVLLLVDYQLPSLVNRCKPPLQASLLALTFCELVTSQKGRDVARGLVEAIIDAQMAAQVSIDTVADVLQERCGSFCNADDVRLYKALEFIRRAKGARDETAKNAALQESMKLLLKATAQLPFDKLKSITDDYRALGFDAGAIELPLRCAQAWDPNGLALAWRADPAFTEGKQVVSANAAGKADKREAAYKLSMQCYALVIGTLQPLEKDATATGPVTDAAVQQALERSQVRRANAYAQAQASTDELFHVALYDWLMERKKFDELLSMRTPFVEEYLRGNPCTKQKLLLLCSWYVGVGQHFAAAQVYAGMSSTTVIPNLTLEDRLEYLARASSNSKSAFAHTQDIVEFTTDIDERLEVARVQVEVYKQLQESDAFSAERKRELLGRLDERLEDISTLYKDYAEKFDMHEVKLMIYHVSDHRDPEMVRAAWGALLAEAHDSEIARPELRYELVASTVVEIGKRFLTSEVAFPVDMLTDELESYAYDVRHAQSVPIGWAPLTLLSVGAPPEMIYDVLLGAFMSKRSPWNTKSGAVFVLADISALLQCWLDELLGSGTGLAQRSAQMQRHLFPAKRIDEGLTSFVLSMGAFQAGGAAPDREQGNRDPVKVLAELRELQERVRRAF